MPASADQASAKSEAMVLYASASQKHDSNSTIQEALKEISRAISLNPAEAKYHALKAMILSRLEDQDMALVEADKALRINPRCDDAWIARAVILDRQGKQKEAAAAAERAVVIRPTGDNFVWQAEVLTHAKRLSEAEKILDQVIKSDKRNESAYAHRVKITMHNRNWSKAIPDLTYLLENADTTPSSRRNNLIERGYAYTELKQYDKAVADYKMAQKSYPDDREVQSGLLRIYELSGNTKEAALARKKLQALDEDFKPFK